MMALPGHLVTFVCLICCCFFALIPVLIECQTSEDCDSGQFRCETAGNCIPIEWQCDYENDCDDKSDEENCPLCADVGYSCHGADKCVAPQWKCDNWTDCAAGDDESYCKECTSSQFECYEDRAGDSPGQCIKLTQQCDYRQDCYHNEDELDCPSCEENGFTCDDGATCIANVYVCDGVLDCADYSDECGCSADLINYTRPAECGDSYGSSPTPAPTKLDVAPTFSICEDDKLFLGFIVYNDSAYVSTDDDGVDISTAQRNHTTAVYWTPPTLGGDTSLFDVDTQFESGSQFAPGFHTVDYNAVTKDDPTLTYRTATCVYRLFVIDFMKASEVELCSKGADIVWQLTVNDDDHTVIKYEIDDTVEVLDAAAAIFYRPNVRAECYANIHLTPMLDTQDDDKLVEDAVDWIEDHLLIVIGALCAVILLICMLCCAVMYFVRKHAEYKEYDTQADTELSGEYSDSGSEDDMDDPQLSRSPHSSQRSGIPTTGMAYHHGRQMSHMSQMSQMSQVSQLSQMSQPPPQAHQSASVAVAAPYNVSPMNSVELNHAQQGAKYPISIDRRGNGVVGMNNSNSSSNNVQGTGPSLDSINERIQVSPMHSMSSQNNPHHGIMHPHLQSSLAQNGFGRQFGMQNNATESSGGGGGGVTPESSATRPNKPLTRRRSVLGIAVEDLDLGHANDLMNDNDDDNEDTQLLNDQWNQGQQAPQVHQNDDGSHDSNARLRDAL